MVVASHIPCFKTHGSIADGHLLPLSTHVPPDEESEKLLEAVLRFDTKKFYAKALILQWKSQQLPLDTLPPADSSRSHELKKADSNIMQLLYSFALLLSQDRPNHRRGENRSAGKKVTACALRQQSLGRDRKKYTLYAAMNMGFNTEDRGYVCLLEQWVKSRSSKMNEIDTLVFDHLTCRIQSYLDGISSDFKDVTGFSTWTVQLVDLHRRLAERCCFSMDQEEGHRRLRLAAKFVADNRKHAKHLECCLADNHKKVRKMWDEIERLSRIQIAIDCLIAFRNEVIKTNSGFEIMRIKYDHSEDSLIRAEFKDSEDLTSQYVEHISEQERKDLRMDNRSFACFRNTLHASAKLSMKVHCEIQLLEHLLVTEKRLGLGDVYNYIGCSKEPCWLCDFVIRTGTGFNMATSHAGVYWSWALPRSVAGIPRMTTALREADRTMLGIIKNARVSGKWQSLRKRKESLSDPYFLTDYTDQAGLCAR